MRPLSLVCAVVLGLAALTPDRPDERKADEFVPMFNGKDLTGWVNVNCAPSTFFVKDGEVITTGHPTGYLRTEKQYENFIADFEWMHVNKTEVGNSGFFVWADPLPAIGTPYTRGIEVQVLVNLEKEGYYTSQGDLFSIHGATCKPDRPHPHGWDRCLPSENRCKGGGEWNHYRVLARDGTLKLHVNGKEVSGLRECKPRKGYLALESEGAECHFRNLKIQELPSSNPKPDEVAAEAKGFHNLFTGLDLTGWKADDATRRHWKPQDWILHYDGKGGDKGSALRTDKEFDSAEFLIDCSFPARKEGKPAPCVITLRGGKESNLRLKLTSDGRLEAASRGGLATADAPNFKPPGQWNRLHITLEKNALHVAINGIHLTDLGGLQGSPPKGPLLLMPEGEMQFGNLFAR